MNDQDLRQSPKIQLLTGLAMFFAARTIPTTAITVPDIRNDITHNFTKGNKRLGDCIKPLNTLNHTKRISHHHLISVVTQSI